MGIQEQKLSISRKIIQHSQSPTEGGKHQRRGGLGLQSQQVKVSAGMLLRRGLQLTQRRVRMTSWCANVGHWRVLGCHRRGRQRLEACEIQQGMCAADAACVWHASMHADWSYNVICNVAGCSSR